MVKAKNKINKILSKVTIVTLLSTTLLSTTGCENGRGFNRQDAASLMGAIGGGILGSNIGKGKGRMVGAAVGALGGAAFGSWLGENLEPRDREYHYRTTQTTLETVPLGETREWTDPDTHARGYVTPTRTYKKSGKYCREYNQKIVIGGKEQSAYGTACRQEDGSWEIQE
ncbi:MAG: glycine zipper 2TM domain-containing protein [Sphingobacteriia bacterium]|nr:glycine zipper 2TM domain-containing protein [Sphingobacteriia bacterium]